MPSQVLVRAQLKMTSPGDSDEKEANEVADSIVKEGKIARSVSGGHSGGGIALPSSLGSQLASMQGHGSQLPGNIKAQMETGFGRDFSNVRVHTDSSAASMSESISAKAFTFGNDIYFNRGQFDPGTTAGQHLIAHELTHVVQGSPSVRRKEVETSNLAPDQVQSIQTSFKTRAEDFSDESKELLDQAIIAFNQGIAGFEDFANGTALVREQFDNSIEIPDIGPLIQSCNKILQTNGQSRLRSKYDEYRIELNHPEVRKYLLKRINSRDAGLFRLWMQYSPKHGKTNAIYQAFGYNPLKDRDFVSHTYTMRFVMSTSGGAMFIVGASGELAKYVISYSNNLGLQWSMMVDRLSVSGGVGFSIGPPVEMKFCAIEGMCASPPVNSPKWFTPADIAHSKASLSVEASVHAGFAADVSSGVSLVNVLMPGKGELLFDMSGTMLTMGIQGGVGAKYGMSGAFGMSNATALSQKGTELNLLEPSTLYQKQLEKYQLDIDALYFETGSYDVYSQTFGSENKEKLKRFALEIKESYRLGKEADTLNRIIIEIEGIASPLWTLGRKRDREAKNLELSQKRANAAAAALKETMRSVDDSVFATLIFRLLNGSTGKDDMTDTSVTASGDQEGMEETGDIRNNEVGFRRADIDVYLELKRAKDGLTRL